MKRLLLLVLVLMVVGGVLAGVRVWARTAPEAAVEFLSGAGLEAGRAESWVAWAGGQEVAAEEEPLVASGSIEAVEVAVVSETGGQIVALLAGEGDSVIAGQVLVQLDARALEAQAALGRAAEAVAEANLANVRAGTHPAQILAARAALEHAVAQLSAAETALRDVQAILANPQDLDAQVLKARTEAGLAVAAIEQAQARVAAAEADRDRYRAQGSMEEKWLYAVYDHQVSVAQEGLAAARAQKEGADRTLAALEALRDNPLALVSQVHQAEGHVEMAAAGVGVAEAQLRELEAGPRPEEVAVAEARVAQAQAALGAVQTQIAKMALISPLGGVVTSCAANEGEAALAGTTLLTVADLDEVRLTIYVPQDELDRVFIGQEVDVRVDSFPGRSFPGIVSSIAQQAEFTPKNVQTEKQRVNMVFAVRVRVPNPGHLLKPGMPADAILSTAIPAP
jgi:HlyD family secretion protein